MTNSAPSYSIGITRNDVSRLELGTGDLSSWFFEDNIKWTTLLEASSYTSLGHGLCGYMNIVSLAR